MTHIEESRDSSDKRSSFRCAEELPSMTLFDVLRPKCV